eukprot:8337689-Ditylum_brightwellii.AAC.1
MPKSYRDTTVQMETSPSRTDLGVVPSVDASIQQTSPSTTVEIEHSIVPPKPTTDNMFTPHEGDIPINETDAASFQEEMEIYFIHHLMNTKLTTQICMNHFLLGSNK